jgi:hypothetical protein
MPPGGAASRTTGLSRPGQKVYMYVNLLPLGKNITKIS